MEKELKKLIVTWRKMAKKKYAKSSATWKKLGKETLPQEDDTIYSVYEDAAAGDALTQCAEALEQTLARARLSRS